MGGVRFAGLSLHSQFVVCWSFGAAGFGCCSFCRRKPAFSVRCVLELWCGWFWVVFVLQAEACVLSWLSFRALVLLVLGGVRFAGCGLHSQFVVYCSFGAAGFGWCSFCRLKPAFSVRCVLELWCGWFWIVFVLQAEACIISSLCWSFGAAGFGWCSLCCLNPASSVPCML